MLQALLCLLSYGMHIRYNMNSEQLRGGETRPGCPACLQLMLQQEGTAGSAPARPCAHDVSIGRVKAQRGGRQAVRDQVHPEQLHRVQDLRHACHPMRRTCVKQNSHNQASQLLHSTSLVPDRALHAHSGSRGGRCRFCVSLQVSGAKQSSRSALKIMRPCSTHK